MATDPPDREFLEMTLAWLASFSRSLALVQAAVSEKLHEDAEPTLTLVKGGA